MNLTRTVIVGTIGGALVAWLSWAAAPAPRPLAVPRARASAVDRSGAELAREIARLHERLRPGASPTYARNVFAFPGRPHSTAVPSSRMAVSPIEAPDAAPAAPALTLSGMAEDAGPNGIVRTAIISGAGGLYLAREGDAVASRYQVERLTAEGADLRDVETGAGVHLSLR